MQLVPFTRLLQRASNLLGLSGNSLPAAAHRAPPPIDGEIVYSKNNVCIHQASSGDLRQIPGYFTLRCQSDEVCGTTLVLTWVPNRTIKSNPRSVHSSTPPLLTPESLDRCDSSGGAGKSPIKGDRLCAVLSKDPAISASSNRANVTGDAVTRVLTDHGQVPAAHQGARSEIDEAAASTAGQLAERPDSEIGCFAVPRPRSLILTEGDPLVVLLEPCEANRYSAVTPSQSANALMSSSILSSSDAQGTSGVSSLSISPPSESAASACLLGISDVITEKSDLAFYESLQTHGSKKHQLPVFCVDLGLMKSLRLFYSNDECTCGQLVVASRESQYKIFHFYHGGLDKLAEVLNDWNLFNEAKMKHKLPSSQSKLFQVVRPKLPDGQGHPEEGYHSLVTTAAWQAHMNDHGQICDELTLRRDIFFGGLDTSLRQHVWPFLLDYFPFESTYEERDLIRRQRHVEYYSTISKIRQLMTSEEKERFWRATQNIVEKDVVRTDRLHPYYAGDDNPNVDMLKEILLNYAAAHPKLGYSQGMSDLLAPLLAELKIEADVYWCFVGLMRRTIFISVPRDVDMDKQLVYLKELFRLMVPKFYSHLCKVGEALGLLFVHRWILLCFKREFQERDAMSVWEACWTHYQTEYFHLFICVAIVALYGDDVVHGQLPADEMLLHFGSLSMHMNCRIVLKKARGLLHQFRLLETIPCTVVGLCTLSGTGMWDSGHVPSVHCIGSHGPEGCPLAGQPQATGALWKD